MSGGGPELIRLMRVIWLSTERASGLPGAGLLVADDGGGDMNTVLDAGCDDADGQRGDGGSEQDDDDGDHAFIVMALMGMALMGMALTTPLTA